MRLIRFLLGGKSKKGNFDQNTLVNLKTKTSAQGLAERLLNSFEFFVTMQHLLHGGWLKTKQNKKNLRIVFFVIKVHFNCDLCERERKVKIIKRK